VFLSHAFSKHWPLWATTPPTELSKKRAIEFRCSFATSSAYILKEIQALILEGRHASLPPRFSDCDLLLISWRRSLLDFYRVRFLFHFLATLVL
jgi:hypothetical protein